MAETSIAPALLAPRANWTRHATEGMGISGVRVPTIIRSRSLPSIPAISRALFEAKMARSELFSPSSAMCLSLIPVLVVIHSSLVSIIDSRSLFVRTLFGTKEPVPIILDLGPICLELDNPKKILSL